MPSLRYSWNMNIENIRAEKTSILALLNPYGIEDIKVFGSFARGENNHDSDLDLLVKLKKNLSLLKLARVERLLSEKLGIPVQLITENGLNPLIKNNVINEALSL